MSMFFLHSTRLMVRFVVLFSAMILADFKLPMAAQDVHLGSLVPGWSLEKIYENDFANFDPNNWVMEGPGTHRVVKGEKGKSLLVETLIWKEMRAAWEQNNRETMHPKEMYYPTVGKIMREKAPERLPEIQTAAGKVAGGHIVLWNKEVMLPESYLITYQFKPLSPIGLAILFFASHGANGEDIFTDNLKKRSGIFNQYVRGSINSYHISYWANNAAVGKRGTCNLRKNSGFLTWPVARTLRWS